MTILKWNYSKIRIVPADGMSFEGIPILTVLYNGTDTFVLFW